MSENSDAILNAKNASIVDTTLPAGVRRVPSDALKNFKGGLYFSQGLDLVMSTHFIDGDVYIDSDSKITLNILSHSRKGYWCNSLYNSRGSVLTINRSISSISLISL